MQEMIRRFDEIISDKVNKVSLNEFKEASDKIYMVKADTEDFIAGINSKL
jgi:hypothetical protein